MIGIEHLARGTTKTLTSTVNSPELGNNQLTRMYRMYEYTHHRPIYGGGWSSAGLHFQRPTWSRYISLGSRRAAVPARVREWNGSTATSEGRFGYTISKCFVKKSGGAGQKKQKRRT